MKYEKIRFGDLYAIGSRNGLSKPSKVRGLGYKMINMGELFANDRIYDIPMELVPLKEKEKINAKVEAGDLLFARQSLVLEGAGKCSIVMEVSPLTVFESHLIRVRLLEEANPSFYYYYFRSALSPIKSIVSQCAQAGIRGSDLQELCVLYPPKKTQDRIANILEQYDNLIENNQKQIKLLEEAAQRLYKEWFVDLHFPGYEDVKIVDGLPEGWEKCSIMDNDVFIFAKSKITPFEGLKLYYATADVTGTEISGDGVWVTFQNKPSRAAIKPINDSVWFARMSNSYKILCCYGNSSHLSETTIISSGFAGFTAREGCFGFVFATIASKWFDKEKNRYATGATQVSLTNEGLKKIQVVLPTKNVAEEYSRIVEPYIEKAEQLKRSIKLLSQARDRLLPKLMSGEIEV
ncbi:restriction endonuclease subunit S [uncultured Megasphaera sp.]|uniref:restriction endonuclease subunit S n=1 Tax=uncultured Megasphaera sp. TaxID=165188 RepID=UPI0025923BEA|nr:restriction endonuclease subunit S [uncultured Megasphaera sp.]